MFRILVLVLVIWLSCSFSANAATVWRGYSLVNGVKYYRYGLYEPSVPNGAGANCTFLNMQNTASNSTSFGTELDCLNYAKSRWSFQSVGNTFDFPFEILIQGNVSSTGDNQGDAICKANTFWTALFIWSWTDFVGFGFFCLAIFAFVKMIPS